MTNPTCFEPDVELGGDVLVVGSGLFGATVARIAMDKGYGVTVIERRNFIGGNIRTERINGIDVHCYGAHIFHTNNKIVWDFVNKYAEFNRFTNSPIAYYSGNIYNLPFNMNTFYQLWGCKTPKEAKKIIDSQRVVYIHPHNLEEQALSLVGKDIYIKLIKGYTEKQWGRPCTELPPDIIKRLPVRYNYDNNYFNAKYQGVPIEGYTNLIERLLDGATVLIGTDYLKNRDMWNDKFQRIVYTGPIDEYFGYSLGNLEYRSLTFRHQILNEDNFQGNAVVNYTDREIPYTRIIEHKHFVYGQQKGTIITEEYPETWKPGMEPYYPIEDKKNYDLLCKYRELAASQEEGRLQQKVYFCGRLGQYKYYDMDKTVESAMSLCEEIL